MVENRDFPVPNANHGSAEINKNLIYTTVILYQLSIT